MWRRTAEGRELTFHLAGINNQNFIMRDEQTGSYWQQVSGRAISGPMQGAQLELVPSDELSFALWKKESPDGSIFISSNDKAKFEKADWEKDVGKLRTVLDFPGTGLASRAVVMGIEHNGESRAYLLEKLLQQKVALDRLGGDPLALVVGPDGRSVRVFLTSLPNRSGAANGGGVVVELFRGEGEPWRLIDSVKGSEWNFQGCATSGAFQGQCLTQVDVLKDYWFDWRQYHPKTSVFRR